MIDTTFNMHSDANGGDTTGQAQPYKSIIRYFKVKLCPMESFSNYMKIEMHPVYA